MLDDLDTKLINKIKTGDSSAFEFLFNKYYSPLCLLAAKTLHDLDSAREVVQNLFVYIWENRENINIQHSVKSYLVTSVRFNCYRYEKKQSIMLPIESVLEDVADELYDSLELEELHQQLLSAIEELPCQCQRIFRMSRFEEMKYSEIAEKLNLSIKTIETQMGKALKMLRKRLNTISKHPQ